MTDPKPKHFEITTHPICQQLIGTLGKSELEFTAALIVRWHHVHGHDDWVPFSRADIATLFGSGDGEDADAMVKVWGRNPFWRPDPIAFDRAGFLVGWGEGRNDADQKGTLTPKFFAAVRAEWDRRAERGMETPA